MLLEEKEVKGSFSVFLSCDKRQELLEKGRWWASKSELRSQGCGGSKGLLPGGVWHGALM